MGSEIGTTQFADFSAGLQVGPSTAFATLNGIEVVVSVGNISVLVPSLPCGTQY